LENEYFGSALYDINYRNNVANKKPKYLPKDDDVKALMDTCINIMHGPDIFNFSTDFIGVRHATATYLILFNARRGLYYYTGCPRK